MAEAEFDESPRETKRDPGVTFTDRPVDETRRDPRIPGQGPPPGGHVSMAGAQALMRLPGTLAARFAVIGELPVQGAESDLLHVRGIAPDTGTGDRVVKIYRRGYHADRDVWEKLPDLDSPHVVRILETGHADGRDYEVIEYMPAGNLRSLIPAERPRLPADTVAAIAGQLADGLDALHRAGIVHRDLKPENVLVACADPLRLVITDFGLSKVIEESVVFASSSRTLAYAAPESLSGQVSPARDWWSLGMIIRELLTGRPPFAGMSETVVVDHLATRPIDNDDIADPRLRLLCRGLLTRDPRRRWNAAELAVWAHGGTPEVADEPSVSASASTSIGAGSGMDGGAAGRGLPFDGRLYTDRSALARALVAEWDTAARFFFARGETGEAWRALRDWLADLGDGADAAGRIELIDTHLAGPQAPDVKLLHLVRWLDPDLPPHYLGHKVGAAELPGLAALAADDRHPDHRSACLIGRALWEHRLLPVLAGFAGGSELTAIDARWRGHVQAWNDLAAWLRERLPATAGSRLPAAGAPGRDEPPTVLLTLLALAARPAPTTEALAASAARARDASGGQRVPWFGWLADGATAVVDDPLRPLRLLAVVRTAPEAALEAEAQARDVRAAEHQAAERRRWWAERENARLAGRGAAVTRAVLWSLPLLVLWTVGGYLVDALFGGSGSAGTRAVGAPQGSRGLPLGVLLAAGSLTWLVECGAEVLLARRQGKDYLPYGPWSWLSRVLRVGGQGLSAASRAVSGTAQNTGRRGCGFLLIAGIVPVLLLLILLAAVSSLASPLWLLALVAVAAGHTIGAGVRLHHWRAAHEAARAQALEGPYESSHDGRMDTPDRHDDTGRPS